MSTSDAAIRDHILSRCILGAGARIASLARLKGRLELITLGDDARIEDFALVHAARKITFHTASMLGSHCTVFSGGEVEIGSGSRVGPGVVIGEQGKDLLPIRIGAACTIGANAVILPGAVIADGEKVSPQAVIGQHPTSL